MKDHMKNLLKLFALAVLLLSQTAYALEAAVLLPVAGPLTSFEKSELSREVVQGLASRFELKHGDEVGRFVEQVFREESRKKDCDESNCYRRIAAQFHAEKIVALRLAQMDKGKYLVTLHLYEIASGGMLYSESGECIECTQEKLKALCKQLTGRMAQGK